MAVFFDLGIFIWPRKIVTMVTWSFVQAIHTCIAPGSSQFFFTFSWKARSLQHQSMHTFVTPLNMYGSSGDSQFHSIDSWPAQWRAAGDQGGQGEGRGAWSEAGNRRHTGTWSSTATLTHSSSQFCRNHVVRSTSTDKGENSLLLSSDTLPCPVPPCSSFQAFNLSPFFEEDFTWLTSHCAILLLDPLNTYMYNIYLSFSPELVNAWFWWLRINLSIIIIILLIYKSYKRITLYQINHTTSCNL